MFTEKRKHHPLGRCSAKVAISCGWWTFCASLNLTGFFNRMWTFAKRSVITQRFGCGWVRSSKRILRQSGDRRPTVESPSTSVYPTVWRGLKKWTRYWAMRVTRCEKIFLLPLSKPLETHLIQQGMVLADTEFFYFDLYFIVQFYCTFIWFISKDTFT